MTAQEQLWRGSFGDDYHQRNPASGKEGLFLARALRHSNNIHSAVEFGAGTGANLVALSALLPAGAELWAVEINAEAAERIPLGRIIRGSMLDEQLVGACDLVMTKGALIHIAPEDLPVAYGRIYDASRRCILLAEYYSPQPRMIPYRGQDNALWARDFAGEMLDRYPQLDLIDYGFAYRRDRLCPQNDVSWFLMEKRA